MIHGFWPGIEHKVIVPLTGIDDHPVVLQAGGGGLINFDHERLAGIDAGVNITDRGGLVAADDDAAVDDLWECLGQPRPDNQAAEKTDPAAHILEFAVQGGGRFAEAIAIDQHSQAGEGAAIRADGNGGIKTEFFVCPARITLGNVIGDEGHA